MTANERLIRDILIAQDRASFRAGIATQYMDGIDAPHQTPEQRDGTLYMAAYYQRLAAIDYRFARDLLTEVLMEVYAS